MNLVHWADQTAVRVIKEKGDKEIYTLASGVSPSGFAHFGHLREVITTDFVARALIKMGKKVRFIYSWDDFDTFRKVPGNLPNPEMLTENLFKSVSQVPDPFGKEACLADAFEKPFEKEIAKVGIDYVEFIRQGKMYPQNKYNKGMQIALKNKDKIKKILDEWRKEPLPKDYLPINFYCEKCGKDRTNNTGYDGRSVSYHCESCGFDGSEDIETTKRAKLPWKVDWPMRWAYEKVDFEPGGKDHSTQGSSYTVGKKIVELFDWTAPAYIPYEFVNIKGQTKKISSSGEKVLTISNMLQVYTPEMLRWIYASYKSNVKFDISFDLDVIKMYEDFDRLERVSYGLETLNEKKTEMAKRVYELAQLNIEGKIPEKIPFRPSFRHLCNVLQINDLDISATKEAYKDDLKTKEDEITFEERAIRAKYWIENYAPEDFKFLLNHVESKIDIELSEQEKMLIEQLVNHLETDQNLEEKSLQKFLQDVVSELNIDSKEVYPKLYQILVGKTHGPKLAGFILSIGHEKIIPLLKKGL